MGVNTTSTGIFKTVVFILQVNCRLDVYIMYQNTTVYFATIVQTFYCTDLSIHKVHENSSEGVFVL